MVLYFTETSPGASLPPETRSSELSGAGRATVVPAGVPPSAREQPHLCSSKHVGFTPLRVLPAQGEEERSIHLPPKDKIPTNPSPRSRSSKCRDYTCDELGRIRERIDSPMGGWTLLTLLGHAWLSWLSSHRGRALWQTLRAYGLGGHGLSHRITKCCVGPLGAPRGDSISHSYSGFLLTSLHLFVLSKQQVSH